MPSNPTMPQRFWNKVDKTGECWLWTAARYAAGYGAFWIAGQNIRAHRVAYELTYGPVPAGLFVLHDCPGGDNPACVNPAHLWLGTNDDNMADKVRKGRQAKGATSGPTRMPERMARGERHGRTPLTADQVRVIRARYAEGDAGLSQLGREYGVTAQAIRAIVLRKSWRHI